MTEKKELSQLARQILSGGGHVKLFNQQEFDAALALAKAEIIDMAVQATRHAIGIENEACAELAEQCVDIKKLADAIRNRWKRPTEH